MGAEFRDCSNPLRAFAYSAVKFEDIAMSLKNESLVIRECMHFFTLPEDPAMVKKIKPQRTQSTQRVVISLFRPLCVLRGFPKPYFKNIKKSLEFWSLQRENQRPKI